MAKGQRTTRFIEELMAEKSAILTKAQAFAAIGLPETSQTPWGSAASYEERIASPVDAQGGVLVGSQAVLVSAISRGRPSAVFGLNA